MRNSFRFLCLMFLSACGATEPPPHWEATHSAIVRSGRTIIESDSSIVLISSASYIEFNFSGDSCIIFLRNIAPGDNYNYVSLELDNEYKGRLKIDSDTSKPYVIKATLDKPDHQLRIMKATEAQNGQVVFTGIRANRLNEIDHPSRKKIEFIGNSITCGMGNDISEIACDSGQWYDQHNAYWAYGTRTAMALDADFMLSSVSGIGIYRTWNGDQPSMPQLYESAYLSTDRLERWDFNSYTPDVVSICLGTNDLSDGDGKTARAKFDSSIFVKKYIDFIGVIYRHYPKTRVVLLSSPMLAGEKGTTLLNCLESVRSGISKVHPDKAVIEVFQFKPMIPHGCSYHPDKKDHEILANELMPFLKQVLAKVK